ncbi:MAG: hypothetical protein Q4A75_07180 [Peptostreptococcaceae bacterium]|nr:hypothetical protein [Peptostreptococcaceae bacterium]
MQKKNYLVVVVIVCLVLLLSVSFYSKKGSLPPNDPSSGNISQTKDDLLPGAKTQNTKNVTEKKILSEGMHRSNVQFHFQEALETKNGEWASYWIGNNGKVAVQMTIDGWRGRTLRPGENGWISVKVTDLKKGSSFKAVPTPNGGKLDVEYKIIQANEAVYDDMVSKMRITDDEDHNEKDLKVEEKLYKENGEEVNFWVRNDGDREVIISNGDQRENVSPKKSKHISANVTKGFGEGGEKFKFEVTSSDPNKNINVAYRIIQNSR